VLEEAEAAERRGAEPLAEILGYGATSDAYHLTAPEPDGSGAAMAIELAMRDAGIEPSELDYVNAHGTSTPLNDLLRDRGRSSSASRRRREACPGLLDQVDDRPPARRRRRRRGDGDGIRPCANG